MLTNCNWSSCRDQSSHGSQLACTGPRLSEREMTYGRASPSATTMVTMVSHQGSGVCNMPLRTLGLWSPQAKTVPMKN